MDCLKNSKRRRVYRLICLGVTLTGRYSINCSSTLVSSAIQWQYPSYISLAVATELSSMRASNDGVLSVHVEVASFNLLYDFSIGQFKGCSLLSSVIPVVLA